jgi:MFS superfamily sulfate permease-like transporter
VVPWISRSALSVSGPAAGLTSIVLVEVQQLGGINPFLTAVVIAGVFQFLLGVLRSGRFSAMVPSAVIKGMLAAIGITIIWKQLPVAFGATGGVTDIVRQWHTGAVLLAGVSLVMLYGWKQTPLARFKLLSPALLVVVAAGVIAQLLEGTSAALETQHFVEVPLGGLNALWSALPRPDIGALANPATWMAGATIAIVASIETLLSVQAVDRLDPLKRHSPPDRELMAQGTANAVSGLLGGLPLTAVIVRSGANVAAGARERLSAVVHGVLLLVAVIFAGPLLNMIPLAALAAVLIQVGLNLCKPALFATQVRLGITQLLPFAITIAAVLAMDLLKGVVVGLVAGVGFVLYENSKRAVIAVRDDSGTWRMRFRRDGTFVSKPGIVSTLDEVDDGEQVVIDGSGEYIDHDVKEVLASFIEDARHRNIKVTLVGIDLTHARAGGGH